MKRDEQTQNSLFLQEYQKVRFFQAHDEAVADLKKYTMSTSKKSAAGLRSMD
jgi:hypothetical protein